MTVIELQNEIKASEVEIAKILSKLEHDGIKFKSLTVEHVDTDLTKPQYKVSITADISAYLI
jgi:hypothetical protein